MNNVLKKIDKIYEEWHKSIPYNSDFQPDISVIEIFKNPTQKEFNESYELFNTINNKSLGGCRGLILVDSADVYVWNSHMLHHTVIMNSYIDGNTSARNIIKVELLAKTPDIEISKEEDANYEANSLKLDALRDTFNTKQPYVRIGDSY